MRCHSPNHNKALPFQPWQQCSERCLWCVALKTDTFNCILHPTTARASLTGQVSTLPAYEASQSLWNLTRPPCVPLAWVRVHNAPLPLRHWLRCQQTATLSVSDSYSAAKWQKHGSCVRIYSVVKIHCWRAFLSHTVVSLYSELPPSMMMSPASRRGTWEMIHRTDQVRQGSSQVILAVWRRTRNPPVYQWSRPQPAQLWPAGRSSWVSSAWTPCPPETLLRSLWNPSPHSAGSRAPLTRSDCRHRPVERGLLIRLGNSWITRSLAPVMTLPRSHGHSCSWWGSGPWQPTQSVRCLLWGGNRSNYIYCSWGHLVTTWTWHSTIFFHGWHLGYMKFFVVFCFF